jgi:hypothetical protein
VASAEFRIRPSRKCTLVVEASVEIELGLFGLHQFDTEAAAYDETEVRF